MGDDRAIPCFFVHLFKVLSSIPARRAKMPIASRRLWTSALRASCLIPLGASDWLQNCDVGSPMPTNAKWVMLAN